MFRIWYFIKPNVYNDLKNIKESTTPDGVEAKTFELEVQRADQLRHKGTAVAKVSVKN